MRTWAPLWSSIVDSSIWAEPDFVCKVFLTMMALKDADHVYRGTAFNLAMRSHKTEVEVLEALKILSSPDSKRVEPQPHGGRRIKAVEEGWLILNGEKYRALVSLEMRRARNRRSQAAYRERQRLLAGKPLAGEEQQVRQWEAGNRPTERLGDRE
jgi:hypothetical protein